MNWYQKISTGTAHKFDDSRPTYFGRSWSMCGNVQKSDCHPRVIVPTVSRCMSCDRIRPSKESDD